MKKIAFISFALFLFLICSFSVLAEDVTEMPTEFIEIEEGTEIEDVTEAEEAAEFEPEAEELTEEATETECENDIVPEISLRWVNCYINKALAVLQNRVMYIDDDALYLPAEEIAPLLGMECESIDYAEGIGALRLAYGDNAGYFFSNSYYAVINDEALNLERPAYLIDDVLYIPLDIFVDVFGVEQSLDTSVPDPDLYLTSFLDKKSLKYAERVKSIKSDTDYLIWICKSDFSLRLFKKSSSGWVLQNELPVRSAHHRHLRVRVHINFTSVSLNGVTAPTMLVPSCALTAAMRYIPLL